MLPKNIPTTAASLAADDYVHINGVTNASRKFLLQLLAPVASPTFTGVPSGPTPTGLAANALTNVSYVSTVVAAAVTTAVQNTLTALYPVGEILITHRTGNPNSWLGFGTWVAYGAGRGLVGLDTADVNFDALDKTGGSKTHSLAEINLPSHTHAIPSIEGSAIASGLHSHTYATGVSSTGGVGNPDVDGGNGAASFTHTTEVAGLHSHDVITNASVTGGGLNQLTAPTAINHMNPFITVAFWRRTA